MARLIDSLPEPKYVRPKKLIVLSRSRTGTFSLYQALNMLGFKTYHMFETVTQGVNQMDLFTEAIRCKFDGAGKPYGRAEFDKWLADYEAIVEIPQFFVPELIEAYPEAQFIMQERTPESWVKSMNNTAVPMFAACRSFPMYHAGFFDAWLDRFVKLHWALEDGCFHGKKGEEAMKVAVEDTLENSRIARARVPEDKLLVCRLEDGFGWEEICPFLGVPIPSQRYPKGNAPEHFQQLGRDLLNPKLIMVAVKVLSIVAVPIASFAAYSYLYK